MKRKFSRLLPVMLVFVMIFLHQLSHMQVIKLLRMVISSLKMHTLVL